MAVKSSSDVAAVTTEIKEELPGATVLTSKSLADQVTGSLNNAHKLANDLGGALAIVVLARRVPDRRLAHALERRQARP